MGNPLSQVGPVYKHCIFFSKNKELVPRPSIMEKSGLRCTMCKALFPGSRGRTGILYLAPSPPGPFLLGPELSGA